MSLREIQKEQDVWSKANFDNKKPYQPILGATEEVGELAHAYLKMEQGIRGTKEEHTAAMKDAVGDCVIFLMDLCNQMGWDFENVVNETWDHVKKRNWKQDNLQDTAKK
jgi:NTP pyrophosphatase (non-canonical NTP hydrolase)